MLRIAVTMMALSGATMTMAEQSRDQLCTLMAEAAQKTVELRDQGLSKRKVHKAIKATHKGASHGVHEVLPQVVEWAYAVKGVSGAEIAGAFKAQCK